MIAPSWQLQHVVERVASAGVTFWLHALTPVVSFLLLSTVPTPGEDNTKKYTKHARHPPTKTRHPFIRTATKTRT